MNSMNKTHLVFIFRSEHPFHQRQIVLVRNLIFMVSFLYGVSGHIFWMLPTFKAIFECICYPTECMNACSTLPKIL